MTLFHSSISFCKRLRSGTSDPAHDWLTLLMLATFALAGIIVWNAWAFETVAQGGVIGSAATSSPPVFSRTSLDAIHAIFVNRAEERQKYETGVYRFADPSQ